MGLLKAPGGAIVSVPDEEMQAAQAGGYTPVSMGEAGQSTGALAPIDDGALGTLGAAATSTLSGLTLGASDVALRGLLTKGQADRVGEDRAAHPWISGAGQLVGSVLPAFAAPESLLTRSPAGLTSKLGQSIAGDLAGEGAGLAARVAAHTASGAVEGALYGGGNYLSQVALENKPLSAEGFVGSMGSGALFAAPIGGALTLGAGALIRARSLFPGSQVTAEAARGVQQEATSALSQAVSDGEDMASKVRQQIALTDAQTGMAQAGEGVTRKMFGAADPQAITDQIATGVDKGQLTDALQRYESSKAELIDWAQATQDPDLESALGKLRTPDVQVGVRKGPYLERQWPPEAPSIAHAPDDPGLEASLNDLMPPGVQAKNAPLSSIDLKADALDRSLGKLSSGGVQRDAVPFGEFSDIKSGSVNPADLADLRANVPVDDSPTVTIEDSRAPHPLSSLLWSREPVPQGEFGEPGKGGIKTPEELEQALRESAPAQAYGEATGAAGPRALGRGTPVEPRQVTSVGMPGSADPFEAIDSSSHNVLVDQVEESLTPSEKQSMDWYSRNGDNEINNHLRDPSRSLGIVGKQTIADLDAVIGRHHADSDMLVFRGLKSSADRGAAGFAEKIADAPIGSTITDPGFMSTTSSESVAGEHIKGAGGTRLEIEVPKGRPIAPMVGAKQNEMEMMLPRNTTLQIVSKEKIGDQTWVRARVVDAPGETPALVASEPTNVGRRPASLGAAIVDHAAATPEPGPPRNLIKTDRQAGGSQGGAWYRDERGQQWFGKHYNGSVDRVENEHLASDLYRMFGVDAPETHIVDVGGKKMLVSREVPGEIVSTDKLASTNAKDGFVMDAWLGNWDSVGTGGDNMLAAEGRVHRVDNGGATIWRAQGGDKEFSTPVKELESMRHNADDSGKVFGGLTDKQVDQQLIDFADKYEANKARVFQAVDESGLSGAAKKRVRDGLQKRADWLMAKADDLRTPAKPMSEEEFMSHAKHEDAKLPPEDTEALRGYTGNGAFGPVNGGLRESADRVKPGSKVYLNRMYHDYVDHLDRAIAQSPAPRDMVVYRGVNGETPAGSGRKPFSELKAGDTFDEHGFVSTSSNPEVGAGYSKGFGVRAGAELHITVPKGFPAAPVLASEFPAEREFILPRGAKYRVSKVEQLADGTTIVHATIATPDPLPPPIETPKGFDLSAKETGGSRSIFTPTAEVRTGVPVFGDLTPATFREYAYSVRPSELAEKGLLGATPSAEAIAKIRERWAAGEEIAPVEIRMPRSGGYSVDGGNEQLFAAAQDGDRPVVVAFRPTQSKAEGVSSIADDLKSAASTQQPGTPGIDLNAKVDGAKVFSGSPEMHTGVPKFKDLSSVTFRDHAYVVRPSELAAVNVKGIRTGDDLLTDTRTRSIGQAWTSGKSVPPLEIDVSGRGDYFVADGNHRVIAAAIDGDRPLVARFRPVESDISKMDSLHSDIRRALPVERPTPVSDARFHRALPAQSADDNSLEALLRGTKSKLDEGAPIGDVGRESPARQRYVADKAAAQTAAAEHFRAAANDRNYAGSAMGAEERAAQPASDLEHLLRATKGGLDSGASMGDVGAAGRAMHDVPVAAEPTQPAAAGPADLRDMIASMKPVPGVGDGSSTTRVSAPGEPVRVRASHNEHISLGRTIVDHNIQPEMQRLSDDDAIERALSKHINKRGGKNVDIGPDLARAAKAIGEYEGASADLVDLLGKDAPPSAIESAKAYRASTAAQADAMGASSARAAADIGDKMGPATTVDSDITQALRKHDARAAAQARRAADAQARRAAAAPPAAGVGPASTGAAAQAAAAQDGGAGVLGKAADVGTGLEVLKALGMHVPSVSAIPVIGPVLGLFLKARAVMGILGRRGGSIAGSVEGVVASKAAATMNRIVEATTQLLKGAGRVVRKASVMSAGAAVLLGSKLFPGGADPKSKDPQVLYKARMDEISRALAPGAIDQAIGDRIQSSDPHLQDAIVAQVRRGIQFLAGKAPRQTVMPGMLPGDGEWKPSRSQLETWGRYVQAVNDPASVLEDLVHGHVTIEGAETLRTVYPALYAEAQKTLIELAPAFQKTLPYPRRVSISIMFQVPIDGTMTPSHMQFLQTPTGPAASAAAAPSGPPPGVPAITGPFKTGQQTMTSLDRRAGA